MSAFPSSNGTGPDRGEDLDVLCALAALEGVGAVDEAFGSAENQDQLARYEAAAGAVFAALSTSDRDQHAASVRPTPGFEQRLEQFVMAKVEAAGDASGAPGPASSVPSPAESLGRRAGSGSEGESHRGGGNGSLLRFSALVGWAAAAALLGAIVLSRGPDSGGGAPVTPADARTALLSGGSDVETVPWQAAPDAPVQGDVVWSDSRNEGYMRIQGLEVNDPSVSQYQLWIFRGTDPGAEPHPVDGGVFDVTTPGEVIVPIDAKLGVGHAGLFAVTVEEPGGVVVSEREKIVLLAARKS